MTAAGFAENALAELHNAQQRRNLRKATTTIRTKRAAAVAEVDDWEALREAGARIKDEALLTLDVQLERLETSVTAVGGTVHWARDARAANAIVARITRDAGSGEVVKVKSMATDEIGLNAALAAEGITAHETDLADPPTRAS